MASYCIWTQVKRGLEEAKSFCMTTCAVHYNYRTMAIFSCAISQPCSQALMLLTFALMTTGAVSRNIGKLFSKLKLVPDNLFIYAEAN